MTQQKSGLSVVSKGTVIYKEVRKHRNLLATGIVLAIDPSCGSSYSDPGYAVYSAGELQKSGIISLNKSRDLPYRLQQLRQMILALADRENPDALVVEHIPPRRFGGNGSATAHSSLLQAMGVSLASTNAPVIIRVRPRDWQKLASPVWNRNMKSDIADAEAIGWSVINLAQEIINVSRK